ncbi:hypothetical protein HNP73_000672 [Amaricoccus macauensis]|uniref:DUF1223 domain-containing protein n=1 Tax=Amaricoccus macauensis TaxID=57001 RepID=A0A840SN56_9RHOB|nr:DUF1223 domain-containing protein [Amaricoccus macauensis]MBB5220751.1 hypothetical protein [Amaricoccus macauensis]
MRSIPTFFTLLLAAAPAVRAQETPTPVVVELYTSQGCIACPPADALFGELATLDGVIALALHVDYWDYMGWKDKFGSPEHTARQKAYARAAGSRTLYTPQMVVQGQEQLKGHDAQAILADIARRKAEVARATVSAERKDVTLTIRMQPVADPVGPAEVHVVSYIPSETVAIETGDNAGQEITYANIVTNWRTVGRWDGEAAFEVTVDDAPAGPLAIVVQTVRMGPVLAAAVLP